MMPMAYASDAGGTGKRSATGSFITTPRNWIYIKKSKPGKREMRKFDT
jgi:hypothetical protein